ncbi:DUF3306 domain-containing protein [soil metagenome]
MSAGDSRAAGDEAGGFLSRWARRKQQVRAGVGGTEVEDARAQPAATTELPEAAVPPVSSVPEVPSARVDATAEALPTMADVALLTRESNYARFVAPGIDNGVKQAAMKKLFADPHFNVMDGLDTYIDDYSQPDPIPLAMLRRMNQSKFLGLFDDDDAEDESTGDEEAVAAAADSPAATSATVTCLSAGAPPAPTEPEDSLDDHADLRLQQDDAAGRPGPAESARA